MAAFNNINGLSIFVLYSIQKYTSKTVHIFSEEQTHPRLSASRCSFKSVNSDPGKQAIHHQLPMAPAMTQIVIRFCSETG